MGIISARGFSDVTIMELARELHCSGSTLYKIASSKDSLVVLAIARWSKLSLEHMEVHALQGRPPRTGRASTGEPERRRSAPCPMRSATTSIASSRRGWPIGPAFQNLLSIGSLSFLTTLSTAGELEPMNTRFLAQVLRR